MNRTAMLCHTKEVAGKIAELQTAIEQLPDITVAACGVKPEDNTFSQAIIDMREVQA